MRSINLSNPEPVLAICRAAIRSALPSIKPTEPVFEDMLHDAWLTAVMLSKTPQRYPDRKSFNGMLFIKVRREAKLHFSSYMQTVKPPSLAQHKRRPLAYAGMVYIDHEPNTLLETPDGSLTPEELLNYLPYPERFSVMLGICQNWSFTTFRRKNNAWHCGRWVVVNGRLLLKIGPEIKHLEIDKEALEELNRFYDYDGKHVRELAASGIQRIKDTLK